jgi:hypothetical protein
MSTAVAFLAACGLSVVVPTAAIAFPSMTKWLLALALMGALTVAALWSPYTALVAALVYAVFLGLLRRLLPETSGPSDALGDPLLLVLPVLGLLTALFHLKHSRLDLLSKVVLALQIGLGLSVLNPLGAGVTSGVAQFLVVALPMSWFWVTSRAISLTATHFRIFLGLITTLGVAVTAYGRYQINAGFPPWDAAWIEARGVNSLLLGNFVRPFSTFTAATDYGTFVGLSLMSAAALLLSPATRSMVAKVVLVLACAFFIRELVLLGSRGILVTAVLPMALGLLVRAGVRLRYAIVVGIAGVVFLPTLLSSVGVAETDPMTTNDAAVTRQLEGLSDPFGQDSTLPGHIQRLVGGVTSGLDSPLGHGVGVIGLGSFRAGGGAGTETSYGDLGVALGLVGTALGLLFAGALLWKLGRQPRGRQDEAYWMLLFLAALPFGPPVVAGNYAAQVVYYALLGCVWQLLAAPVDAMVDANEPRSRDVHVDSRDAKSRGASARSGRVQPAVLHQAE